MTTGEKIRNRRLEMGMTMEDLGKAIGVQRSAINKYEKGLVNIKSKTLVAIANALSIAPVLLMEDTDEDIEQYVTEVPQTKEAIIISAGIDKMEPERREQALKVLQTIFADIFDGGEKNET